MANLYIISGCNGAGKTTASFTVLPEMLNCREFINADEIAKGISPFQPEKVAIQAGKIMLGRIADLIEANIDFAIETTLTTKSYLHTIALAKLKGYTVTLLYFWLDNVDLAIERVKIRVNEGGHSIPEEVIRRRYQKGKNNLKLFRNVSDYWLIIDNSTEKPMFIADGNLNVENVIFDLNKWEILK